MIGTLASVMTLLMIVGCPNNPLIAGSGGFARTWPRLPSRLSSSEVSSPQMYAPAPSRTSSSKALPLPRMFSPRILFAYAVALADLSATCACGYSQRR